MQGRRWRQRSLRDDDMQRNGKVRIATLVALVALSAVTWRLAAGAPSADEKRQALYKAAQAGNFKDAYEGLKKLALDPQDDPLKVSEDLRQAITCLQRLGRVDEIDTFREGVIAAHKDNWRL